jgi:hypothetical protein
MACRSARLRALTHPTRFRLRFASFQDPGPWLTRRGARQCRAIDVPVKTPRPLPGRRPLDIGCNGPRRHQGTPWSSAPVTRLRATRERTQRPRRSPCSRLTCATFIGTSSREANTRRFETREVRCKAGAVPATVTRKPISDSHSRNCDGAGKAEMAMRALNSRRRGVKSPPDLGVRKPTRSALRYISAGRRRRSRDVDESARGQRPPRLVCIPTFFVRFRARRPAGGRQRRSKNKICRDLERLG